MTVEQDVREMLAAKAAEAVPAADPYERVRRRIARHRQRRGALVGAVAVVALAGGTLVAVRGPAPAPYAARHAAFVSWPARGELREDAALVERAVRAWEAAVPGRQRDAVRLLWAGPVSGRPVVVFQATERGGGARLALAAVPPPDRSVRIGVAPPGGTAPPVEEETVEHTEPALLVDAPAPPPDEPVLALVEAAPSRFPNTFQAVLTALLEPGATFRTARGDDSGDWFPVDGGHLPGGLSRMAGSVTDPASVRVTVTTAAGETVQRRAHGTGRVESVDAPDAPAAEPNPARGDRTVLGWTSRNADTGPATRDAQARGERLAARLAAQTRDEPGPIQIHFNQALPDGTVATLGTFGFPTRIVLHLEPPGREPVTLVGPTLVRDEVLTQVSAVFRGADGKPRLLVIGAPTTYRAMLDQPEDRPDLDVPILDGWGVIPVDEDAYGYVEAYGSYARRRTLLTFKLVE